MEGINPSVSITLPHPECVDMGERVRAMEKAGAGCQSEEDRATALCEVVREGLHEKTGPEGDEGVARWILLPGRMFQVDGRTVVQPLSAAHARDSQRRLASEQ